MKTELAREANTDLTETEIKVLRLLLEGCDECSRRSQARPIAETLCIAPDTAHTHKKNIYRKLGTKNVFELFSIGRDLKLVHDGTPGWS